MPQETNIMGEEKLSESYCPEIVQSCCIKSPLHPGRGLCLIHVYIVNVSNVSESLWVPVVQEEEVGWHEGRRRNGGCGGIRDGAGSPGVWWGPI